MGLPQVTVAVLAAVAGVDARCRRALRATQGLVTAAYRALAGTAFVAGGLDVFKDAAPGRDAAGNVELARADLVAPPCRTRS
jgi:hypothetical protein